MLFPRVVGEIDCDVLIIVALFRCSDVSNGESTGQCVRNRRKQTDSFGCRLRRGRILGLRAVSFSASANLKYIRGSPISRRRARAFVFAQLLFQDTKRQVT